jgi:YesN/AraC family two-component response regulator
MSVEIKDVSLLIVDDSIVQRQYVQALCCDLGIQQVHEAANGVDALTVLETHQVDVVLIDLEMPVMDGVDLISSISKSQLSSNVVILSAKYTVLF